MCAWPRYVHLQTVVHRLRVSSPVALVKASQTRYIDKCDLSKYTNWCRWYKNQWCILVYPTLLCLSILTARNTAHSVLLHVWGGTQMRNHIRWDNILSILSTQITISIASNSDMKWKRKDSLSSSIWNPLFLHRTWMVELETMHTAHMQNFKMLVILQVSNTRLEKKNENFWTPESRLGCTEPVYIYIHIVGN